MIGLLMCIVGLQGLIMYFLIFVVAASFLSIGFTTCIVGSDLYAQLFPSSPLDLSGPRVFIFLIIVCVVIIILSELGPIARLVGKAFIISQIGMLVTSFAMMLINENLRTPLVIISTIIAIVAGFLLTEDLLDFLTDHPILSILSAIPASVLIFDYIFIIKAEFFDSPVIEGVNDQYMVQNAIGLAKESLIITIIAFAVFTAVEIFFLIRKKAVV